MTTVEKCLQELIILGKKGKSKKAINIALKNN